MKIALIGYGKMGQMIDKIAQERGHEVIAKVNSQDWSNISLKGSDVCIEFTHPEAAMENIRKLIFMNKNLVIGTTGWYDGIDEVRQLAQEAGVGVLYSPNFSIGVQLYFALLEQAAHIMKHFKEYDAACVEMHHNQKKDLPSGTALEIAHIVDQGLEPTNKLPISSVRCGSIPGTHTLLFDSPCDTISITHTARNREGFARGAVLAAEWLQGKKGLFTFAECIQALFQRS